VIGYLAVYGNQQWPALKKMDAEELSLLYHCVSRIKKAEADASKQAAAEAAEKAKRGGGRRGRA
jgi:hypothetical protein